MLKSNSSGLFVDEKDSWWWLCCDESIPVGNIEIPVWSKFRMEIISRWYRDINISWQIGRIFPHRIADLSRQFGEACRCLVCYGRGGVIDGRRGEVVAHRMMSIFAWS